MQFRRPTFNGFRFHSIKRVKLSIVLCLSNAAQGETSAAERLNTNRYTVCNHSVYGRHHVTGKERHGKPIAKLRTSPARRDAALPVSPATLPRLQLIGQKGALCFLYPGSRLPCHIAAHCSSQGYPHK